ncbi:hypothetical protein JYU34_006843 [Plutella xylostella]|uniref:Uncharacterized protein n=1 Tax=Plutella xylostella TaxID=51655 RepID=A0ABQ7QT36_PLUXY|nr:hypothetical protein JYU34_006843 [Plutella xylostella]
MVLMQNKLIKILNEGKCAFGVSAGERHRSHRSPRLFQRLGCHGGSCDYHALLSGFVIVVLVVRRHPCESDYGFALCTPVALGSVSGASRCCGALSLHLSIFFL